MYDFFIKPFLEGLKFFGAVAIGSSVIFGFHYALWLLLPQWTVFIPGAILLIWIFGVILDED